MSRDDSQEELKSSKSAIVSLTEENEKFRSKCLECETFAKQLKALVNENKELKKAFDRMNLGHARLQASQTMEETANGQSIIDLSNVKRNSHKSEQVLHELHSSASPALSGLETHSSSFQVLGKNSRDITNPPPELFSIISNENNLESNFGLEDFTELAISLPNLEKENSLPNGTSLKNKTEDDKLECHQSSLSPETERSLTNGISNEFIQVFPQSSRSAGSDFCFVSLDQEMTGGMSCTNSSRRGPMSINFPNKSIMLQKEDDDIEEKQIDRPEEKYMTAEMSLNKGHHTDPFNGTGARPRDSFSSNKIQSTKANGHGKDVDEIQTINAEPVMVKIPGDNSADYRINNEPMLPFGRENSQTEISDFTSFGSLLPESPKTTDFNKPSKLNDLNMEGSHNSTETQSVMKIQSTTPEMRIPKIPTQEEFIEKSPPSKQSAPENLNNSNVALELMKELEDLRSKTKALQRANKEWNDQWQTLKRQKDEENQKIHAQMKNLMQENMVLRQRIEYAATSQKEELFHSNLAKKEFEKMNKCLKSERTQEKLLLEKLKQDYGNLHQEKRALEVRLEHYTVSSKVDSKQVDSDSMTRLENELAAAKRQAAMFMEDFHKENHERLSLEKKLKKEKETNQSVETKLKRTHDLLKSRDEDLRLKVKLVFELQSEVEDLKLKLEVEQRRASIYPSINASHSIDTNHGITFSPLQSQELAPLNPSTCNDSSLRTPHWSCPACTFDNNISNKKCELCGTSYTCKESKYG